MDFKNLIGRKAIHKTFGAGVIVEVKAADINNVHVVVDFNGVKKTFPLENLEGFFRFDDEETRNLILNAIQEVRDAKAAEAARQAEAERLAAEEAERMTRENPEKKEKRNRPIHPYINGRRNNDKHAIFLVCQNNNFQIESDNGFIWAPTHTNKGESEVASHAEMDLVKKGDIIFHHFNNHIYAISVARADCTLQAAVAGHPDAGIIGRYVDLSYHILATPADTSSLKHDKALYGSMKYGPFTKDGQNKQGFYLSELADDLAIIFIDAAIAANPGDLTLVNIKNEI